jgi:hypothetical protein
MCTSLNIAGTYLAFADVSPTKVEREAVIIPMWQIWKSVQLSRNCPYDYYDD